MRIETQFGIGDKVWVVAHVLADEVCEDCGGTTKLTGHKGRSVTCPSCHFGVPICRRWIGAVVGPHIVIAVRATRGGDGASQWGSELYTLEGRSSQTGTDVFPTQKEAEAAVKAREAQAGE